MSNKKDYSFYLHQETYERLRKAYREDDVSWDQLFNEFADLRESTKNTP